MDLQFLNAVSRICPRFLRIIRESPRSHRHTVDGQNNAVFRQPDAHCQDQDEESQKQGNDSGKEDPFKIRHLLHGNIYTGITLADSVLVHDRQIDRKQPAIRIIGNDRIDLLTGEQSRQHRKKRRIKGDHISGLRSFFLRGVRIKDYMTSVLQDPVDIDKFNIRRAV